MRWNRAAVIVFWAMSAAWPLAPLRAAVTRVADQVAYPEGPLWWDGQLLYVEYAGSDIKRWDGKTLRTFWHRDRCGPSGLFAFDDGHLLVACYDTNSLIELDARGHEVRRIDKDQHGNAFIGPNDFASDGKGGVYFSASGVYDLAAPITGAVLHLAADRRTATEVANTIHYSNGLTVSADGAHLLVAEGLAGRILSFPIEADGRLGPRSVWARLRDLAPPTPNEDAFNGPDGLKLGPDGNYYIAQNGSGRVLVVDDKKHLVRSIDVPTPFVTNLCFGPSGADTLFVTGTFDQFHAPYAGAVYRWTASAPQARAAAR
jgi:gluconolactonase